MRLSECIRIEMKSTDGSEHMDEGYDLHRATEAGLSSPSWGLELNGDKENKCIHEQIVYCGDDNGGNKQTAVAEGGVRLWGTVF